MERNNNLNQKVQYDLPSSLNKRSAGIGKSMKFDFTKLAKNVPAPNSYKFLSDFDKSATPSFTFGTSREATKVQIQGVYLPDPSVPGPGSYTVPSVVGKEAAKCTLTGRIPNHLERANTAVKSPGPGQYQPKLEISKDGKYFYSKFKSSRATTWNPPSSARFSRKS